MMIDVRQNIRAAAEPPSNLRVEKHYGSMISSIITIKQRRGRSSTNAFTPVSSFYKHGGVLVPEGQL